MSAYMAVEGLETDSIKYLPAHVPLGNAVIRRAQSEDCSLGGQVAQFAQGRKGQLNVVTRKYPEKHDLKERNHEVGEGGTETGERLYNKDMKWQKQALRTNVSEPWDTGDGSEGRRGRKRVRSWVFEVPSPPDQWEYICETSLRILWENMTGQKKKIVK